MSSKSRRQQANAANRNTAWILVAVAAVVIVVLSVMAAKSNTDGVDTQVAQVETDARGAALASEDSPTTGNPDAKVHIVEFLDPACGTCARHVAFHEGSEHAVRVLEASRNQDKYWETLEALLMSQQQWVQQHVVQPDKIEPAIVGVGLDMERLRADMNTVEVMRRMEKDKQDSIRLKVSATPEYFVNGRSLPSFGQQQLADLVREELQK
jgi:protein-disulfide isomerase